MTFSPIQKNVPPPKHKFRGPVFEILSKLQRGDYLETNMHQTNLHEYARRYGMKIRTSKLENLKLGVWCIKPFKL